MNEQSIEKKLSEALKYSKADQTEVLIINYNSSLTRFANNYIHQNMSETNVQLIVRAIIDKKIGIFSANSLQSDSIKDCVEKAVKIARNSKPNNDFISLPKPTSIKKLDRYSENTANYSPNKRALAVSKICMEASKNDLNASGAFSTSVATMGVANSLGVMALDSQTESSVNTVILGPTSSGFAADKNIEADLIDVDKIAYTAVDKALKSSEPDEIKPGKYTVILEPQAVCEMIGMLAYIGLGAKAVQEGRSFMVGKFEKKIASDLITLYDDAYNPAMAGFAFDYEGVAKQRVDFIDNGTAKAVVYDSMTAKKEGKESTGHGLPASSSFGPLPLNVVLAAGTSSIDEMIAKTENGVLVTRFHYTNIEEPINTIFTGMTRDGTFLIKDGKLTKGLKNMRFTQSILECLSNTIELSKELSLLEGIGGAYLCPALMATDFNFSSVTI